MWQPLVLTSDLQVYSCLTESSACLAPSSLRFQVTLLPASDGENFSEIDLGNVFSLIKWVLLRTLFFPRKHAKHVCLFQVLEVERLPDHLWNFLRDCPYCVLLFWIMAFDLEKEFCGTQIVHIYHRLHINLRTLKKSCTLIFLCLPMPKSLLGLTQYNSTVDLIKSIFPFQKLLWWWMWQREFWWNATLPWSRCSSPSTEILIPFLHFSFFCILMRSSLLAQNLSSRWQVWFPVNRQKNICFQDLDETHLFISPDVLEQLKAQIDDLMDKISVPIVEGVEKKWKLKRNWELGLSTCWRYRSNFEGDCRKWTVPKWFEELRPVSNWGSRIYRSNIFFCHLTQSSAHKS